MTESCFDGAKFEIIKRHYGLSEDDFTKHVQKLYEWLITQPHLPHDVGKFELITHTRARARTPTYIYQIGLASPKWLFYE